MYTPRKGCTVICALKTFIEENELETDLEATSLVRWLAIIGPAPTRHETLQGTFLRLAKLTGSSEAYWRDLYRANYDNLYAY